MSARGRGWSLAALGALAWPWASDATVAAQRARLPPPAACPDPIAGTWKSHAFNATVGHWNQFTLEIHREGPERLRGRIANHSWDGTEADVWPPTCAGALHYVVSMDAEGGFDGEVLRFHGVGAWRLDELLCGDADFGYNLDDFTGRLDPELQEFQSLNNDGGLAINVPTVFRRVSCAQGLREPVAAPPPPFFPPVGGGCW